MQIFFGSGALVGKYCESFKPLLKKKVKKEGFERTITALEIPEEIFELLCKKHIASECNSYLPILSDSLPLIGSEGDDFSETRDIVFSHDKTLLARKYGDVIEV
jgi:hypothetical protein